MAVSPYSNIALQLLRTNSPPAPLEEAEIRFLIDQEKAKLSAVDMENEGMEDERARIQQFVDDHRKILSPLRRLPAEIIGEIVRHASDGHDICPRDFGEKFIPKAPWVFTHVSSRWRSVVIGLASLWATISMPAVQSLYGHKHPPNATTILSIALERSGQMALSISCTFNSCCNPAFLDHILSVCSRWKTVHLIQPRKWHSRLNQVKGSIPLLEKLSIRTDEMPHLNRPHLSGDWLLDAPRLRHLDLGDYRFSVWKSHIPWHQLTHFPTCYVSSLSDELELLRRLTHLEEYAVVGPEYDNGPSRPNAYSPVTLSYLKVLSITPQSWHPPLLSLLTIPHLHTLEWGIFGYHNLAVQNAPIIQGVVEATSGTLTSLTLDIDKDYDRVRADPDTFWAQLIRLLTIAERTEVLIIKYMVEITDVFTRAFLRRLVVEQTSPDSAQSVILPNLKNLSIKVEDDYDTQGIREREAIDDAAEGVRCTIADVLCSRKGSIESLKLHTDLDHAYARSFRRVFNASAVEKFAEDHPSTVIDIGVGSGAWDEDEDEDEDEEEDEETADLE